MTKRINDALSPDDGWVAAVYPLDIVAQDSHDVMGAYLADHPDLPDVEFTISGFWDDIGPGDNHD